VSRTVRRHRDFLADVRKQVRWLERHREKRWMLRLREAIREATRAVARFPALGSPVSYGHPGDPASLRKLVLRDVPFVIWYAVADDDVWLLRLFHARQKRP
jgi:plasmid stabilization system protein ParE